MDRIFLQSYMSNSVIPSQGEIDDLIVSHCAHIVLYFTDFAVDMRFDFHYRLSTRSRVKYLTLESKHIIAIISRTVHTSLPAISRTSFANFSWWIAKTEREFWSIRRVFCRRCTSREKRDAMLSNLINILTRDCSSTLFRTTWQCH